MNNRLPEKNSDLILFKSNFIDVTIRIAVTKRKKINEN